MVFIRKKWEMHAAVNMCSCNFQKEILLDNWLMVSDISFYLIECGRHCASHSRAYMSFVIIFMHELKIWVSVASLLFSLAFDFVLFVGLFRNGFSACRCVCANAYQIDDAKSSNSAVSKTMAARRWWRYSNSCGLKIIGVGILQRLNVLLCEQHSTNYRKHANTHRCAPVTLT